MKEILREDGKGRKEIMIGKRKSRCRKDGINKRKEERRRMEEERKRERESGKFQEEKRKANEREYSYTLARMIVQKTVIIY